MADDGVYDYCYDLIIENSGDLGQLNETAKEFAEIYNK